MYSNVRTTIGAQRSGWSEAFNVAFRAGSVMGFALTGMAVLVLYIALWGFRKHFSDDVSSGAIESWSIHCLAAGRPVRISSTFAYHPFMRPLLDALLEYEIAPSRTRVVINVSSDL